MTECVKCGETIRDGEDVLALADGVMHGGVVEHISIGPDAVCHACCWDGLEGDLDRDHYYMTPEDACEHIKRLLNL